MEDGDDKLRRNLVVWSALVIAFWYVGGHFVANASYGPLAFSSPTDQKAWAAIITITIYLTLRHRFSDATKSAAKKMRAEYSAVLEKVVTKYVTDDYTRMMVTGHLLSGYPNALEVFGGWYQSTHESFESARPKNIFISIELTDDHSIDLDRLLFRVRSVRLHLPNGYQGLSSGGALIEAKLSSLEKIALRLLAAAKLAIYSHASTEFFLPFLLALAAFLIAGWRLVSLSL